VSEGGDGRLVVVVDDDLDTADVIREILQDQDFLVDAYLSALDALERIRANPNPCVLIVDLIMRDMDGLEFIQAVRQEGCKVPVIIATASHTHARELDHDELARLNVLLVMVKPLDFDTFVSAVAALAKAECPAAG
jgi:CheY-like chemotaxis protein